MERQRGAFLVLGLGLFLSVLFAGPSRAEGWTSSTSADGQASAGYGEGGDLSAIMLTCEGASAGEIAIVFGGLDAGLPADTDYPAVVSADGVAFVMRGRLRPNALRGDNNWVRVAPLAEAQPMIDALKAGSDAEISTPAGRYRIGLGGSGKALAALGAGCG